jgi:hypothetical protein
MTAAEIRQNCQDIAALLGGNRADAKLLINSADAVETNFVTVMCRHDSSTSLYHFVHGSTYSETFSKARAWAERDRTGYRDTLVRRMAVAVIDITAEHGHCVPALLRMKGFTDADIAALHEEACARASEIAGKAPFSVRGAVE